LLALPFRRVLRALNVRHAGARAHARDSDPERLAWAVGAVARRSIRRNRCLVEAVALTWLLRRDGHPAAIRIGAGRVEDRFEAHAWVESRGRILIGGRYAPHRFSVFPDFEDRADRGTSGEREAP
ncbi:MAG: lasso peptide biosynthesis B2 protein, partial [Gemmatimonadota bacterium]